MATQNDHWRTYTADELAGMVAEGCQGHDEAQKAAGELVRRAKLATELAREAFDALRAGCEHHHRPLVNGWAHILTLPSGSKQTVRCQLSEKALAAFAHAEGRA